MNQDEIIEITRQAGGFSPTPEFLEAFAKLVAAKERELFVETLSRLADSYRLADKQGSSDDICKIINYIKEKGEA